MTEEEEQDDDSMPPTPAQLKEVATSVFQQN